MDKLLNGKRKTTTSTPNTQEKRPKLEQNDTPIEQTIYPGLINNASTCYLNSILQIWFHLPCLRRVH